MLTKRLQTVAEFVDNGAVVADIGCDHGYLCIYLLETKRASKCYAMDVAEGPLAQAQKMIRQAKLPIQTVLSDGLRRCPDDVDTAVIAGMGWMTIRAILEHDLERCHTLKKIILQPNRDTDDCRRWISDHRFTIVDEALVYEKKYYEIIVFNTANHSQYDEREIYFGPHLIRNKTDLFIEYYKKRLLKLKEVLVGCTKKADRERLERQIKMIEEETGC